MSTLPPVLSVVVYCLICFSDRVHEIHRGPNGSLSGAAAPDRTQSGIHEAWSLFQALSPSPVSF